MSSSPSHGIHRLVAAVALVAVALTVGSVAAMDAGDGSDGTALSDGDATTGPAQNDTNATIMVAPTGSVGRLGSVAAVEQARDEGWVTPSDSLALGDTVVFRLTDPDLADAVANAAGDTADARFRSFLGRENVSLQLVHRNPSSHFTPHVLYLNGSAGQTVAADPGNDTYYVAADLTRVPRAESGREIEYPDWKRFLPRLVVDGSHRLNPPEVDEANQTGQFTLHEREAGLLASDGGTLQPGFAAASNQTVSGETTLAPGSTVTVRAAGAWGIEGSRTATARVTRETVDNKYDPPTFVFETELNLSGVDPGTDVELALDAEGELDGDPSERFEAPVDSPRAGVELADEPVTNGTVCIANVTLPDGGFVAVESADGTVVGSSDYLDPGAHEGVRVRGSERDRSADLRVFLVHDSDGDGIYFGELDRPYADDMRAVGASVSPTAPTTAETATPTATPITTGPATSTDDEPSTVPSPPTTVGPPDLTVTLDPTATPAGTASPSATDETAGDGPGFGAVAALLGVLAFVALGVRRTDTRNR